MSTIEMSNTSAADDQLMRTTGIGLLVAVGVTHFVQIVDTFKSTPWLGVGFLALIAGSLVAAALLMAGSTRPGWTLAAMVGAGAIVGFVFTRLIGTSFDNTDVGNWAESLGLAALFVESLLVAVSSYALSVGVGRRR